MGSLCKRFAWAISALVCAIATPALAGTTPGGLAPSQVAKLHTQPLPVVVPGYVPAGFRLARVDVTNLKSKPTAANSYVLRYRSSDGREFTIDVGDSDFGDVAPDTSSFRRPFTASSKAIGPTTFSPSKILVHEQDAWIYASDYRSLGQLGNSRAMLIFSASNVSPDEIRRIYSSLQPLSH